MDRNQISSHTKLTDVSNLIGRIYDTATEQEDWPTLLCDLADFCRVFNAALVSTNAARGFSRVFTPRADPEIVQAYANLWWQFDPTAHATATAPVGLVTNLDFTGRDKFFQSTFYLDYWAHTELGANRLASNLLAKQSQFASVVLQPSRQSDEITRENAQRFQLLLPHLTRSFSLAAHLFQTHIEEAFRQLEEKWPARAIYLLTANGRIVLTNALGESQLDLANLIRCEFGRLNFIDNAHQQKLASSLQICANPTSAAPCRQSLECKWAISSGNVHAHVLPFRTTITSSLFGHPIAALIIDDPSAQRDQNLSILRDKFALTPAEAKLALEMCKGDGRTKAAARLGISVNTARTQLTNIFEKVSVGRQAELIAALIKAGARLD